MAATVNAASKAKGGAKPRPASRPQLPAAPAEPLRFSSEAEVEPEEREPFFYVDETEYTILANPGPGIAVEAMHIMAAGTPASTVAAEEYVTTAMIGEDGWAALRGLARKRIISGKQLRAMIAECSQKAMGALEDEDPNR
jgi:hypothetical protein